MLAPVFHPKEQRTCYTAYTSTLDSGCDGSVEEQDIRRRTSSDVELVSKVNSWHYRHES